MCKRFFAGIFSVVADARFGAGVGAGGKSWWRSPKNRRWRRRREVFHQVGLPRPGDFPDVK